MDLTQFPAEGMHIDDLVDMIMRNNGAENISGGLKNFSNILRQMGRPDEANQMIAEASKIGITSGTNINRESIKQVITIFMDTVCDIKKISL